MKAKQKSIRVLPLGCGHFKISTEHYGKIISTVTTNTQAIDAYRDDSPSKAALRELRNEIIRRNKKVN